MRSHMTKTIAVFALATTMLASHAMAQTASQRLQNYWQGVRQQIMAPHTMPVPQPRVPAAVTSVRG
jgi:hypothetical protein